MNDDTFPQGEKLLNKRQLGDLLQASTRTVDNLIASGQLPVIRIGKLVRFDWGRVKASLQNHQEPNR